MATSIDSATNSRSRSPASSLDDEAYNFSEQLFTRFPELIETNPFRQLERFHLADAKLGTDA